ncbi:hypothetical protein ACWGHD_19050 [Streptomyces xanthophaeus]
MNGPDWLYRVKVWGAVVNSDADIHVVYTVNADEAKELRRVARAEGFRSELSSAVLGDFYRIPLEDA